MGGTGDSTGAPASGNRPERSEWREGFLAALLRTSAVLGAVAFVPSFLLALQARYWSVAIGDTLAILSIVILLRGRGLGYRFRAGVFCAVLYFLGLILLLAVGPISEIYLLGFSLFATMLLGLRVGLQCTALNTLTLAAVGYAGIASDQFILPGWIGDGTGWAVVSLNFVIVNVILVVSIGIVLETLEAGLRREEAARRSLQRSDAFLRMSSRVARLGAWSLALPSGELQWSPETRALHGVQGEGTPGREEILAFYPPEDRERIRSAITRCMEDGLPFDLEVDFVTAGASARSGRLIGEAFQDDGGAVVSVQGAFQDITDRKRLERQMMRTQRLESIGTLAGGIAHDLNNSLTPILACVTFLRDGETDDGRLKDLAMIEASARRGASMVRQVLAFARGEDRKERSYVDVVEVARDVLSVVRDTFPKNIVVVLEVGDGVGPITANPTQVHQLLMNMCVNARDAMPAGGTLTVAVEAVTLDEAFAATGDTVTPGPHLLLRVEDTGVGMPQEVQDRAFEPFFTTKETGKGTGLGLSMCHTILRSHGGFLRLYSEPGRGTILRSYFPVEQQGGGAIETPSGPTTLPRGKGETVLLVDDEANVRDVAGKMLERYGYRVLTASNGAEAVSVFNAHRGGIAAVLTDMSMPVMDGPATIRALRDLDPQVRIIGLSGIDPGTRLDATEGTGVEHFVPKPYSASMLLNVLRQVLDA
ncbi:MAG: ATP-binding protein [Candidatus Binatia bacterium]